MRVKGAVAWSCALLLSAVAALSAAEDLRLIEAVKSGSLTTVRALLKQKIDINAVQGDGATALHWAAYRDDVETADLLIRAGANVNKANDISVTPLMLAATN